MTCLQLDDFFFPLQLRNGGLPTSPLMLINPTQGDNQNGRICQSTIPNEKNTSSNLLYINFVSNGDSNQGQYLNCVKISTIKQL